MKPTIAVVTNIDREHLDHYRDLGAIQDAFVAFLSRVPFYGAAVVCLDDRNVRAILPRVDRKLITYGLSSDADVSAHGRRGRAASTSLLRGARAAARSWAASGSRCPAATPSTTAWPPWPSGLELDVPFRTIAKALAALPRRRPPLPAAGRGVRAPWCVDDYGHHPTEIEATLAAVREGFGARTLVVFQPHRYSRTQALLEEFGACVLPRRPGDRHRRSTRPASADRRDRRAPPSPTRWCATAIPPWSTSRA